jgi:hypothetical protein
MFYAGLWIFVILGGFGMVNSGNLSVTKQNLYLPSLTFTLISLIFIVFRFFKKHKKLNMVFIAVFILITLFDLFRFGWKFEPFTKKEYLFPNTPALEFLQKQKGIFRVAATDSQIFPPNFSVMYGLQTADGYDPLYVRRYGEFAAAYARNKPDISSPFGFNRIITLQDVKSRLADFLGIRFVLSLSDPDDAKLNKVFSDGKTQIYENTNAFPRAFFVSSSLAVESKDEAISAIMDPKNSLDGVAIVEDADRNFSKSWSKGTAEIRLYSENKVVIDTVNGGDGFMVLTDTYYPLWRAKIDGKPVKIYLTDYAFRGIVVPKGKHTVEFYISF